MVRRNGFAALTGLLAVSLILLVWLSFAASSSRVSRSHQAVDYLLREMAMDMQHVRQHSVGSNYGKGSWKLVLRDGGYVLQNGYRQVKERPYPKGLKVTKGDVMFDADGKPLHTMSVVIAATDGTYQRRLVLAAQTGRLRVE